MTKTTKNILNLIVPTVACSIHIGYDVLNDFLVHLKLLRSLKGGLL